MSLWQIGWSHLSNLSGRLDVMTRINEMHIYKQWKESNLFCIRREVARPCKNDEIWCHASLEQPLLEIKVYI